MKLVASAHAIVSSGGEVFGGRLSGCVLTHGDGKRLGSVTRTMHLTGGHERLTDSSGHLGFACLNSPTIQLGCPVKYGIILSDVGNVRTSAMNTLSIIEVGNRVRASRIISRLFGKFMRVALCSGISALAALYGSGNSGPFMCATLADIVCSKHTRIGGKGFRTRFLLPLSVECSFNTNHFILCTTSDRENVSKGKHSATLIVNKRGPSVRLRGSKPIMGTCVGSPSFMGNRGISRGPLFITGVSSVDKVGAVKANVNRSVILGLGGGPGFRCILGSCFRTTVNSSSSNAIIFPFAGLRTNICSLRFHI